MEELKINGKAIYTTKGAARECERILALTVDMDGQPYRKEERL